MKVFGDELRKNGKSVSSGDRLQYVVIKRDNEPLLGKRMILSDMYFDSLSTNNPELIDWSYYLKMIMAPIDQVITIGYRNYISEINSKGFKLNKKSKYIPVSSPIKLVSKMIDLSIDPQILIDFLIEEDELLEPDIIFED